MPVKRFPLVGQITDRNSANTLTTGQRDQFFQNAVFRVFKNDISQTQSVQVRPASSPVALVSPGGSGANRACLAWLGSSGGDHVVSARGDTNSQIFDNTTSLGSITGLAKFLSETAISDVANFLVVADSNRAWFYPAAGALTEITDTDFPTQTPALTLTGNFVHGDGYASIMTTSGKWFTSNLNSLSGWTSNVFYSAQDSPDAGVGLAKFGKYVVALGKGTIEFNQNTGNASGSPYSRVNTINIGCITQFGILQFRDSVVFIGSSKEQGIGVYIIESLQAVKKISNPVIDSLLATSSASAYGLHIWSDAGKIMIALKAVGATSKMFLYDPDVNIWSQWSGSQGIYATDLRLSSTAGTGVGLTCIFAESVGAIYTVETALADLMAMTIETTSVDFGTSNWKMMKSIRLIGDGLGQSGGAATIDVSWADDGINYNTARALQVNGQNPSLYRCGRFRRRSHKLVTGSVYESAQLIWLDSMECDFDVAAH
jgi:hypothetical protein